MAIWRARFVAGEAAGMEIAGIYLPNGNSGGEDGYTYKLRWMERLGDWVQRGSMPSPRSP